MNDWSRSGSRGYGPTTVAGSARAHLGDVLGNVNSEYNIEHAQFHFYGGAEQREPILTSVQEQCPQVRSAGITTLWMPPDGDAPIADLVFVHGLGGHPYDTWQYRETKVRSVSGTLLAPDLSRKPSTLSRLLTKAGTVRLKPSERSPARSRHGNQSIDESSLRKAPRVVSESLSPQTGPRASKPCYWPFDLMSRDFRTARVLTYGYHADPGAFYKSAFGNSNIDQLSQQLLESLAEARAGCQGRPLVFIAHSTGGLLTKNALVIARGLKYTPVMYDIFQSCIATMFFATPHKPMNDAEWERILSGLTDVLLQDYNARFMIPRGLPDAARLMSINKTFNEILYELVSTQQKIHLYNAVETAPVTKLLRYDGKILPDYTTTFGIEGEKVFRIAKNHIELCKLNDSSRLEFSAYSSFASALRDCLQSLPTTDASVPDAAVDVLLENIEYPERMNRKNVLANNVHASSQSFEWLWQSPFSEWLKTKESLFWIRGKPASGKSTLTLYIDKASETMDTLRRAHGPDWIKIYHFFDFRAHDRLENNFEGVVRSLLVQLLEVIPQTMVATTELRTLFQSGRRFRRLAANQISVDACQRSVIEGLQQSGFKTLVLLDGLDEYSGHKIQLVDFILDLGRVPGVKLCLASRPMAPFPEVFGQLPSFQMDDVNLPGIYNHALHRLESMFSRSSTFSGMDFSNIALEVAERSQGVFLWVTFAIEIITIGLSEGQTIDSRILKERLARVPPELADIYQQIVTWIPVEYRELASIIMLLVCDSCAPLTVEVLLNAICRLPNNYPRFRTAKLIAKECSNGTRIWSTTVLAATGGLLTFVDGSVQPYGSPRYPCQVPQLIHRTVDTYLGDVGWQQLLGLSHDASISQEIWMTILAEELLHSKGKIAWLIGPSNDNSNSLHTQLEYPHITIRRRLVDGGFAFGEIEGPFERQVKPVDQATTLAYSISFVFSHAAKYESLSNVCSDTILGKALDLNVAKAHCLVADNTCECKSRAFKTPSNLIQVATGHGMYLSVRRYLEEGSEQEAHSSEVGNYLLNVPGDIWLKKDCVLNWALAFAIDSPAPARLPMLQLALQFQSRVTDLTLATVVAFSTSDIVGALLSHRTSDKLNLSSRHLDAERSKPLTLLGNTNLWTGSFDTGGLMIGPLWILGKRVVNTDTEALLDVLTTSGADLNETCGPFGTVLHSLIDALPVLDVVDMLELLLDKGADPIVSGENGNALEFCWKLANTETGGTYAREHTLQRLIAAGATNTRADPNDQIPTREQMLRWRSHGDNFKTYYQRGGDLPKLAGPEIYMVRVEQSCPPHRERDQFFPALSPGEVLEVLDEDRAGNLKCINRQRRWLAWVKKERQVGGSPWLQRLDVVEGDINDV